MKFGKAIAFAISAFGLSACVSSAPPPMSSAPQAPRGAAVDGNWVDSNGIVSNFQSGTFSTRSTDTNTLLASGTYRSISPTLIEIDMTSLVRNTRSRVNCALVGGGQLNCTTDANVQFSLTRRT